MTVEIIIRPQGRNILSFKEIWQFRELLYFLVWRDIKVRYKQTAIGIFWAVLQPFLTMVVFTFFFNRVLGVTSGDIPYPIFVFTGLLFWNYFSTSLQNVSNSLVANQSIITKVFFPRIIILIATTIVPIVDFFFAFLFLLGLLFFFQVQFSLLGILFILPALLLTLITVVGLGSILAIVNVKYRDVRYALPFFIQLLLFITPVIYSIDKVPANFQLLLYLNPLTGAIESVKTLLLQQGVFPLLGTMISLSSGLALLLFGIFFFFRYEREIADSL